MSKFKVGDRVVVTDPAYSEEGLESNIIDIDDDYFVLDKENYIDRGRYDGATWVTDRFREYQLELVDQTLEDQLAEAEQKVAELKQQIEDRDNFSALPVGSVVRSAYDYVKVGKNNWVSLKPLTRRDNVTVWSDQDMGSYSGTVVIREGI